MPTNMENIFPLQIGKDIVNINNSHFLVKFHNDPYINNPDKYDKTISKEFVLDPIPPNTVKDQQFEFNNNKYQIIDIRHDIVYTRLI